MTRERAAFEAQLSDLRRRYAASLADKADQVVRARAAADADVTHALIHRLAGTAGSYGLADISAAARALDVKLAHGTTLAAIASDLDALITQLRAAARP